MIPDLRARLKSIANQPKTAQAPCECMVIESRTPLSLMHGVASISQNQVQRLGFPDLQWDMNRALFLDTETTGLRGAGTVAFLVGLGFVEEDAFVVRQLLMRDYPEEARLLQMVADTLSRFDCVVTFNGKSFDMPLLRDRFRMARVDYIWRDLPHIDLMHIARRIWKARLGSCTLGALEERILAIKRGSDIPGSEVPERYFRYLKSGDFSLLEDVLQHNEQDVRTLALLLRHVADIFEAPHAQTDMLDVLSAGKALDKLGQGMIARHCFQVASVSELSKQARLHLAWSYRREKDFTSAADAYRDMIAHGEAGVLEYIALAILLEHRLQNVPDALEITEKAIIRFAGGGLWYTIEKETLESLYRRRERLKKKLQRHST